MHQKSEGTDFGGGVGGGGSKFEPQDVAQWVAAFTEEIHLEGTDLVTGIGAACLQSELTNGFKKIWVKVAEVCVEFFFKSLYQLGNLTAVIMAMPSEISIEQRVLFGGQKLRAKWEW